MSANQDDNSEDAPIVTEYLEYLVTGSLTERYKQRLVILFDALDADSNSRDLLHIWSGFRAAYRQELSLGLVCAISIVMWV